MTIGQVIALIKALGGGSGGSLPPVTSADNGKVLAVDDGAWAADSNLFVVNVALNSSYILVADKTYAEISAAIDAGKQVVCVRDGVVHTFADKTSSSIYFAGLRPNTKIQYISISTNNSVSAQSQAQLSQTSAQDNGSEMIVKNGGWTMQKKKFIVTLTPTSPDYSGTMDKTPQEITAAYNAGQKIVFDIPSMNAMVDADQYIASVNNLCFGAKVFFDFNNAPVLITIVTSGADDTQTYLTGIYTLTPAS